MSFSEGHNFSGDSRLHLAQIIDNLNAGIWEYNINTKSVKWSAGFYSILGYSVDEIECSSHTFFEQLLYFKDKPLFITALNTKSSEEIKPIQIRLLTKTAGYQWFESGIKRHNDASGHILYGYIININKYKHEGVTAAHTELRNDEASKIARIGNWEIDAQSMDLTLSKQAYDIYDLQNQIKLSIEEAISFFEPPYRPVLQEAIDKAIKFSQPYDLELLFRSAKNNVIWVRIKGRAIINDYGKCVSIRGTIQDIDTEKRKSMSLESSFNLLTDQNKRLQNFAYIVSHNLRSHTGNLKFMVNLYEETDIEDDKAEIFSHIKTISDSLSTTIGHLNEIVKIQTEITNERSIIEFETFFKNIKSALKKNIETLDACVEYDFSQCPEISYIPAYMESIMQNLLTNALKYSHPGRQPIIKCHTEKHHNHIYLIFEDNGTGIDLARHGDKVFGMYKTFHENPDAKGIGLFITRNQVEALGGSIKIDSTVNVGTKFTIRLV